MYANFLKKCLSILLLITIVMLNLSVMLVRAEAPSITPEPEMLVSDSSQSLTVFPIAENPLGLAEGATSDWYSTNWPYSYTNVETLASPIDISDMDSIEFDLYISDMELFSEEVPSSFPFLDLIDINGVKNRYLFGYQIEAAGWNHVRINLDDLHEDNGMDYTNIKKYQLGTNGGVQSYDYKVLNICATRRDALPEGWFKGVNGHGDFSYSPAYKARNMPETIELAAELGSNIYRANFPIHTAKDIERLDAAVYEAAKYGLEIMLVLDGISITNEENTDWVADVQFIAERYNGKNGHGRIRHFQMSNESSKYASAGNWATEDAAEGYIAEEVEKHSRIFNNCAAVLRAAQEDCIISISSGVKAWYYLKWLKDLGTDFDMINWIWYSHNDYQIGPVERTCFKYLDEIGLPYIIAEINNYPLLENAADIDELNAMISEADNDVDFLPGFIERCEYYAKNTENSHLMGVIIYELLDQNRANQITDQSQFGAEREDHFGLYYTSGGEITGEKPVVKYIKELFGGKEAEPVVPDFTYDVSEPEMPKAAPGKKVINFSENPLNLASGEIIVRNLVNYVEWTSLSSPVDLSDMDYIEFDIYINDYTWHRSLVDPDYLNGPFLELAGENSSGNASFVFDDKITHRGWNHIKIPIASYIGADGQELKDIASFRICANTYVYYAYKVLNVCATGMFVPGTTLSTPQLEGIDLRFDINIGWQPLAAHSFASPIDLSSEKYLVFDIYTSDIAINNNGYNLCMRMFNSAGTEIGSIYTFSHIIKKAGWNRISIDLSHFGYPADVAKIDFIAFTSPCNAEVRVVNFHASVQRYSDEAGNSIAVLGDINYDGSVDFKDFIRMKKNLAEGAAVFYNNDVNGDGLYNVSDLTLYRKYILGVCKLGI